MSKLVRPILLMSLIGLFLALLSFTTNSEGKRYFLYLYFYAPALWLIWIMAVFTAKNRKECGLLLVAWWIIDLMILATLLSLSIDTKNAGQSKGVDVVMLIAYCPVWLPSIFLVQSLPSSEALTQFSTFVFGKSSAAALWCEASLYAAIQSAIISGVARIILLSRVRRKRDIEQTCAESH